MKDKLIDALKNNVVTIIYAVLCILAIYFSGQPTTFIVTEIVTRLGRNTIIILSLLLPVLCGMGLNFGIVLGAMSAAVSLIVITNFSVEGLPGILLCFVIATFLSIALGFVLGIFFNKVKGQEMIAGMIVGFFASGIFSLIFLFLVGSIIPMRSSEILLSEGVGVRNTIRLQDGTSQVIDNIWKMPMAEFIKYAFLLLLAIYIFTCLYKVLKSKVSIKSAILSKLLILVIIVGIVFLFSIYNESFRFILNFTTVPIVTFLLIGLVALLVVFLNKTKLGQDIRTVGQSMHIATTAGINVNKIRIISVIISTVIASWGQIIFIQNMGNLNTYTSHDNVGIYAIAALLVGGASISKATIPQVFIGAVLFHTLFFISPMAGNELFGDPMVGEFFRIFLCYLVIAFSLAVYAWQRIKDKNKLSA